jgi:hypothetical protein
VILATITDGLRQPLAEFAAQQAHDLANPLQGEPTLAQFADNRDLGKILGRVQSAVTLARGDDDAPFIPPLKLSVSDAGELNHVARCKRHLHVINTFETILATNV